jgi:predicted sugar kinase
MWVEIQAPCSLLLGLAPGSQGGHALLALTLQYPPVHLFATPAGPFLVTGARARAAYDSGRKFLEHHSLLLGGEIELELATPSAVGLGSDAMVALSVARALAWARELPAEDAPALAQAAGLPPAEAVRAWGFQGGGLLEVSLAAGSPPALARRSEIAHGDKQSWVFVFHFPHVPGDAPATLEADRLAALVDAVPHLDAPAAAAARDALWQAAEADDFGAFAAALAKLRETNEQALAAAGAAWPVPADDRTVLDLMRNGGAAASGKALTGLASFGLVQGGPHSLELRRSLRQRVGYEGGIVMATVADNRGVRQSVHAKRPVMQGA